MAVLVEVDGLEGADFFAKDITYHDTVSNMKRLKSAEGISFNQRTFAWADNNDGQGYR